MFGELVDRALLGTLAVSVAVLILALGRRYPRAAVILWLAVLCFVPVWLGVTLGPYWPPSTVASVALALAFFRFRAPAIGAVDVVLAFCGLLGLGAAVLDDSTISAIFTMFAIWGLAYVAGRMVLGWVDVRFLYAVVAIAFTIVAVLALAEFFLDVNPFVLVASPNEQYSIWGQIQQRGGVHRAEGAFGHSIALGASIAMALPLTMHAPFRMWIRTVMVVLMLAASISTFSRAGMICSMLAVVLTLLFTRTSKPLWPRILLVAGVAVTAVIGYFSVSGVFLRAGDEAVQSALYRADLLSLVGVMDPLGLSSAFAKTTSGEAYFDQTRSIDSALVLFGLTYGLVPLLLLVGVLVSAIVLVLRRRATPITIAFVAGIPAIATVALITQYASWVWFIAGLAVSSQRLIRPSNAGHDVEVGDRDQPTTEAVSAVQSQATPDTVPQQREASVWRTPTTSR